jgi:tRNA threonylcarbamoyladenosine biosynthesis protein TsaE
MGSPDKVASPSFTLSREYRSDKLTMFHFDFYRLSDPGIMANELAEVIGDPQAVVVVEWADIVEDVLPADRLTIRIKNIGDTSREFLFTCPQSLDYLRGENT